MKSSRPIKLLVRYIGDPHPGRDKRVRLMLCAGMVLFSIVTTALARGFARAGNGARGMGVAPGVGAGAAGPGVGALPHGYVYTVPAGSTTVDYNGATCYYVNGVYYCPVYYEGNVIYMMAQ